MILCDVNVLVYAFRKDSPKHDVCRQWLLEQVESPSSFGYSDLVLSGVVRVVTHPKVFKHPSALSTAFEFVDALRSAPNAVRLVPGARHWDIYRDLCRDGDARGNLAADAYHAALAIEHGCRWVTTDRDFSRFDGLELALIRDV